MKLLLIRHAQSVDDKAKLSQRDDSPLSSRGREQAEKRARLIDALPISAVLTSPYRRTQETAAILFPSIAIGTLDFIYEVKRPRNLDGGLHKNAVHFWEVEHKTDKYKPGWTFDGSESFNDAINRAQKLLQFLYGTYGETETIAIVSHGGFMRHFVGYVGLKQAYRPEAFFDLLFLLEIKNIDAIEVDLFDKELVGWKLSR